MNTNATKKRVSFKSPFASQIDVPSPLSPLEKERDTRERDDPSFHRPNFSHPTKEARTLLPGFEFTLHIGSHLEHGSIEEEHSGALPVLQTPKGVNIMDAVNHAIANTAKKESHGHSTTTADAARPNFGSPPLSALGSTITLISSNGTKTNSSDHGSSSRSPNEPHSTEEHPTSDLWESFVNRLSCVGLQSPLSQSLDDTISFRKATLSVEEGTTSPRGIPGPIGASAAPATKALTATAKHENSLISAVLSAVSPRLLTIQIPEVESIEENLGDRSHGGAPGRNNALSPPEHNMASRAATVIDIPMHYNNNNNNNNNNAIISPALIKMTHEQVTTTLHRLWPMVAPFTPLMLRRDILSPTEHQRIIKRGRKTPNSAGTPSAKDESTIAGELPLPASRTVSEQSSMQHLVEIPTHHDFKAAFAVADISGFTALTEKLSKEGHAGIELLAKCMNSYFSKIIDLVLLYGGDVSKFAGDAVLLVFEPTEIERKKNPGDDGLALATLRAAACMEELVSSYGIMSMSANGEVKPVSTNRVCRLGKKYVWLEDALHAVSTKGAQLHAQQHQGRKSTARGGDGRKTVLIPFRRRKQDKRRAREQSIASTGISESVPGAEFQDFTKERARARILFEKTLEAISQAYIESATTHGNVMRPPELPFQSNNSAKSEYLPRSRDHSMDLLPFSSTWTMPRIKRDHHVMVKGGGVLGGMGRRIENLPGATTSIADKEGHTEEVEEEEIDEIDAVHDEGAGVTAGKNAATKATPGGRNLFKALFRKNANPKADTPSHSLHNDPSTEAPSPSSGANSNTGANRSDNYMEDSAQISVYSASNPAQRSQKGRPERRQLGRLKGLVHQLNVTYSGGADKTSETSSIHSNSLRDEEEKVNIDPSTPKSQTVGEDATVPKDVSDGGGGFGAANKTAKNDMDDVNSQPAARMVVAKPRKGHGGPGGSALLSMKVILTSGSLCAYRVGGLKEPDNSAAYHWDFFIANSGTEGNISDHQHKQHNGPISQLTAIEGHAASGRVIISQEAAALLGQSVQVEAVEEADVSAFWLMSVTMHDRQSLMDDGHMVMTFPSSSQHGISAAAATDGGHSPTSTSSPPSITPGSMSYMTTEVSLLDSMPSPEDRFQAYRSLRSHVQYSVRMRIEAGHIDFVNEVRVCTTVFLGFPSLNQRSNLALVQEVARLTQFCIQQEGGFFLQMRCDEKGFLALAAFGLPGRAHEDSPGRGIQAALNVVDMLEKHGHSAVAGVTTGNLFCAVIGCQKRAEYSVYGNAVNLAARLMMHASAGDNGPVLCDESTSSLATGRAEFESQGMYQLKGKSQAIQIFKASPLFKPISADGMPLISPLISQKMSLTESVPQSTYNSKAFVKNNSAGRALGASDGVVSEIIGRERELAQVGSSLLSLVDGRRGGVIIFEGDFGSGKSRLVEEIAWGDGLAPLRARCNTLITAGQGPRQAEVFYPWRQIYRQIFQIDRDRSTERRLHLGLSATLSDGIKPPTELELRLRDRLPEYSTWRATLATALGLPAEDMPQALMYCAIGENKYGPGEGYSTSHGILKSQSVIYPRESPKRMEDSTGEHLMRSISERNVDPGRPGHGHSMAALLPKEMSRDLRGKRVRMMMRSIIEEFICCYGPLLLIFDGLHTMDSSSWRLILCILDGMLSNILFIGTLRPTLMKPSAHAMGALSDDMQSLPVEMPLGNFHSGPSEAFLKLLGKYYDALLSMKNARRIVLDKLTPAQVKRYVSISLDGTYVSDMAAQIFWERSSGLPAFLQQLVHYFRLRALEAVEPSDDATDVTINADVINREVMGFIRATLNMHSIVPARVDKLTPDEQITLKTASVMGAVIYEGLLWSMHPRPPKDPEVRRSQLQALEDANFISRPVEEDPDILQFDDWIVRDIVYDTLSETQRCDLHACMAAAMEKYDKSPCPLIIIAYHWMQSCKGREGTEIDRVLKTAASWERAAAAASADHAFFEEINLLHNSLNVIATMESLNPHLRGKVPDWRKAKWERCTAAAYFASKYEEDTIESCLIHCLQALTYLHVPMPWSDEYLTTTKGLRGMVGYVKRVGQVMSSWSRKELLTTFRKVPSGLSKDDVDVLTQVCSDINNIPPLSALYVEGESNNLLEANALEGIHTMHVLTAALLASNKVDSPSLRYAIWVCSVIEKKYHLKGNQLRDVKAKLLDALARAIPLIVSGVTLLRPLQSALALRGKQGGGALSPEGGGAVRTV